VDTPLFAIITAGGRTCRWPWTRRTGGRYNRPSRAPSSRFQKWVGYITTMNGGPHEVRRKMGFRERQGPHELDLGHDADVGLALHSAGDFQRGSQSGQTRPMMRTSWVNRSVLSRYLWLAQRFDSTPSWNRVAALLSGRFCFKPPALPVGV